MDCPECKGMTMLERFSDFFLVFYAWKCINCGERSAGTCAAPGSRKSLTNSRKQASDFLRPSGTILYALISLMRKGLLSGRHTRRRRWRWNSAYLPGCCLLPQRSFILGPRMPHGHLSYLQTFPQRLVKSNEMEISWFSVSGTAFAFQLEETIFLQ
jgi:hypothetical protein